MKNTEKLVVGEFVRWASNPVKPCFGVVTKNTERGSVVRLLGCNTEVTFNGDIPDLDVVSSKKAFEYVKGLAKESEKKEEFMENVDSINKTLLAETQKSLFNRERMAEIRAILKL